MIIGGLPLLLFSVLNNDPAVSGSLKEYSSTDILALLYTSVFGSAVSYGVFFYSATKGLYFSPYIFFSSSMNFLLWSLRIPDSMLNPKWLIYSSIL